MTILINAKCTIACYGNKLPCKHTHLVLNFKPKQHARDTSTTKRLRDAVLLARYPYNEICTFHCKLHRLSCTETLRAWETQPIIVRTRKEVPRMVEVPLSVYRSIYLQPPTSYDSEHKVAVASVGCHMASPTFVWTEWLDDWREYRQVCLHGAKGGSIHRFSFLGLSTAIVVNRTTLGSGKEWTQVLPHPSASPSPRLRTFRPYRNYVALCSFFVMFLGSLSVLSKRNCPIPTAWGTM